ncbi:MAG: urea ABC transporter permease subunit UrtB [Candidatus Brocadiales bacterium]|nr:urea ABC transporter permease subunit UrtB [Candidatus Brocadiales bacterium]
MKIVFLLCTMLAIGFGNGAYTEASSKEISTLTSMLSNEDKEAKKNAVRELGNLEDPAALEALNNLWSTETDEEVTFMIEIALNRIKLLDGNSTVRKSAANVLGNKGEVNFALDTFDVQGASLFGSIMLGEQDSINILSSLNKALVIEKDRKVKSVITEAIQKIKLLNKDQLIRKEAAEFLGELCNPDTIMYLGRALEKEKDAEVKSALEKTISKIEKKQQVATIIQQLFNGVSVSSIYLLIAIGLAITFGVMGVINMAHGEFMMLGCYVSYMLHLCFRNYFSESIFGLYFILALPVSFIVTGLFGMFLEGTVIRLLYGRPLDTLLATWGVSLILQQLVRQIFGANNVDVASPVWLTGGIPVVAGLQLPYKRIFIIGFTAAIVAGIYLLLLRTRLGLKIRAVMQNRTMSDCMGIPVRKIDAFTFALGSGLAGVAGGNISLLGAVGPSTGQNYIVDCFMVVVLGGVGKIVGSIAGAFGMGETNSIFEFFTTASMGKVIVFLLVIVFLRFRPTGFSPAKGRN